jgi:hypothetical protein
MRNERQGALIVPIKTARIPFIPRPFVHRIVHRKASRLLGAAAGTALMLTMLITPSVARAELLDRVVASVNNDVITLSELNRAVAFNAALGGVPDDKLRAETLEGLINRHLLLQDAYRLKFVEVSDQDREAELEKLQKRLGTDKAFADLLARLDMTREELGRMLGRRLLVERFVEKKIGLFVRVSREEAQAYFDAHPVEFKGKRFVEVQKPISALLSEQKLEEQTAKYLADLKSRADIRINPL